MINYKINYKKYWNPLNKVENPEKLTIGLGRYEGFRKLIDEYNCRLCVELGVREAYLSTYFATNTRLYHTLGIDIVNCPNARALQERFPWGYTFVQKDSILATQDYPDNWFDFVHLDSSHKYNHLRKEIPTWYKKVRVGGILSGDDAISNYFCPQESFFGVVDALNEFVDKYDLKFYIIGLEETNKQRLNEYSEYMGNELTKKIDGKPHKFTEIPNWFLIKEKDI